MSGTFNAVERRELVAALHGGRPVLCPGCGIELVRQPVARPDAVSYVRHRIQVTCPTCRRTASLDEKPRT